MFLKVFCLQFFCTPETSETPSFVDQFSVKFKMFADDIKIYKNISSRENHTTLRSAINATAHWSAKWELPLSGQKSHVLQLWEAD